MIANKEILLTELVFKFSRSGGAGGQHVNKVSSKVLLQWDVAGSTVFSEDQKAILFHALSNRINKDGVLQLESDNDRSQLKNKEIAIQRFLTIVDTALIPVKARKKTRIPYSKVVDRLDRKKRQSELKKSRSKKFDD
ncbi:alternative ribosome rescue aminoacyl-tRNA hydrolase ArfB [Sphingobacterium spiritivorum]|uniref:Peptidyl-tRNA hydrolase domain family protein n=1 Tax=Sphingobacterium spiritivorum ATCC 33861 TaxID=525373 RepID=D7VMN7_SPHSI|nr:alternative ribosome rescue aminoacyl-tRNA hydrolase ArfB [Sphingobacterium spiritivorum]EFK57184.1 peptidyl-tRNA hydrolase domain family protein [Sphingobacterium spiritivorum ATCC 33861]QQT36723.1 aminoacyl-tRNA hydrolase [Sphingobacterium spiritivorum]WQD33478.1 alternative ribosome rescue aminoacyl-tRNA hydrolase ArfB [Sphingobacterium spiritivorum]SUJ23842.1 Peptidyl-tRNA hydrolase YaeJ [Sphingobacterium spiritivorum]